MRTLSLDCKYAISDFFQVIIIFKFYYGRGAWPKPAMMQLWLYYVEFIIYLYVQISMQFDKYIYTLFEISGVHQKERSSSTREDALIPKHNTIPHVSFNLNLWQCKTDAMWHRIDEVTIILTKKHTSSHISSKFQIDKYRRTYHFDTEMEKLNAKWDALLNLNSPKKFNFSSKKKMKVKLLSKTQCCYASLFFTWSTNHFAELIV